MKNTIILLLIVISTAVFAQEETLFKGELHNGGFGGPALKFTKVSDNFALLVGGYGGWLINHQGVLGLGGYGMVTKIKASDEVKSGLNINNDARLTFGYGGLYLEYIANSDKLVHISVSTLIGSGGVAVTKNDNDYSWTADNNHEQYTNSTIFVIEPAVHAELNITSFMRINAGAGYRIVSGVDIAGLNNSDFSGPSATLSFKFGAF